eukprot:TRINITY_DN10579_c0_g1_i4.p1 TRINITY_DN10579_c0_g1~~TRINITY_DN10579_c0_g1_i4.p1  ORF type:complete len:762 (+),score=251.52 TRINITY_DN10579_c0_g1_i4:236-2521(+)
MRERPQAGRMTPLKQLKTEKPDVCLGTHCHLEAGCKQLYFVRHGESQDQVPAPALAQTSSSQQLVPQPPQSQAAAAAPMMAPQMPQTMMMAPPPQMPQPQMARQPEGYGNLNVRPRARRRLRRKKLRKAKRQQAHEGNDQEDYSEEELPAKHAPNAEMADAWSKVDSDPAYYSTRHGGHHHHHHHGNHHHHPHLDPKMFEEEFEGSDNTGLSSGVSGSLLQRYAEEEEDDEGEQAFDDMEDEEEDAAQHEAEADAAEARVNAQLEEEEEEELDEQLAREEDAKQKKLEARTARLEAKRQQRMMERVRMQQQQQQQQQWQMPPQPQQYPTSLEELPRRRARAAHRPAPQWTQQLPQQQLPPQYLPQQQLPMQPVPQQQLPQQQQQQLPPDMMAQLQQQRQRVGVDIEDPALTSYGRQQCRALRETAPKVELVVVSPLRRALESAFLLYGENEDSIPFVVHDLARETYGERFCDKRHNLTTNRLWRPRGYDKKQYDQSTFWAKWDWDTQRTQPSAEARPLEDAYSDKDMAWQLAREPPEHVRTRGEILLNWLLGRHEKNITVVTHQDFISETVGFASLDGGRSLSAVVCPAASAAARAADAGHVAAGSGAHLAADPKAAPALSAAAVQAQKAAEEASATSASSTAPAVPASKRQERLNEERLAGEEASQPPAKEPEKASRSLDDEQNLELMAAEALMPGFSKMTPEERARAAALPPFMVGILGFVFMVGSLFILVYMFWPRIVPYLRDLLILDGKKSDASSSS